METKIIPSCPPAPPEIELTDQQKKAVDMAVNAIKEDTDVFRIGGYAGTGKTTVAKYIVDQCPGAICCAFTGKAAYRLREKGLDNTSTIHSAIYNYDPDSNSFDRKFEVDGDYFLIDEGSMISHELWDDLLSFKLPVILLGDPGQLEPVGKDPRLMHKCDIVLDQIHRQAAENQIIRFATLIREGLYSSDMQFENDVDIFTGIKPIVKDLKEADIILCGMNRTRRIVNKAVRQIKGHTGQLCVGETLIVLSNNKQHSVFNGQFLEVRKIASEMNHCFNVECLSSDGRKLNVPILKSVLDGGKVTFNQHYVQASYGYAVTVHKSQGSEWDNVLMIDEICPYWDQTRWRYTAITRASKKLKCYFK